MLLNNNIKFVGLNVNRNSKVLLLQENQLNITTVKKAQELGYNIYFILNDFNKKRSENELVGFKYIGIDLDLNESNYYKDIETIIQDCESKLGFLPLKINRTYKGYHIIFKLEDKLYDMSKKDYILLYDKINEILGGDKLMKKITSILKVTNTIDLKNNRNFKIINVYNKENQIVENNFIRLLSKKPKYDIKRKETFLQKEKKKVRNVTFLESIDSYEFIQDINKHFLNNQIQLGGDKGDKNIFIDDKDGLCLFLESKEKKYTIKDFSYTKGKRIRAGNYNFIFNHFLLENKEIEYKHILFFLKKYYNLHLNSSIDKIPIISQEIILDSKKLMDVNKKIYSLVEKGYMNKILRVIFVIMNEKGNNSREIVIKRKEFIEKMKLNPNTFTVKKKIFETLIMLMNLRYEENIKYSDNKKETQYNSFLTFKEIKEGNDIFYKIKLPISNKKIIFGSPKLLEEKVEKIPFLYQVSDNISLHGSFRNSLSKCYELLEYKKERKKEDKKNALIKILIEAKKKKIIREYNIKNNILEIK